MKYSSIDEGATITEEINDLGCGITLLAQIGFNIQTDARRVYANHASWSSLCIAWFWFIGFTETVVAWLGGNTVGSVIDILDKSVAI